MAADSDRLFSAVLEILGPNGLGTANVADTSGRFTVSSLCDELVRRGVWDDDESYETFRRRVKELLVEKGLLRSITGDGSVSLQEGVKAPKGGVGMSMAGGGNLYTRACAALGEHEVDRLMRRYGPRPARAALSLDDSDGADTGVGYNGLGAAVVSVERAREIVNQQLKGYASEFARKAGG